MVKDGDILERAIGVLRRSEDGEKSAIAVARLIAVRNGYCADPQCRNYCIVGCKADDRTSSADVERRFIA